MGHGSSVDLRPEDLTRLKDQTYFQQNEIQTLYEKFISEFPSGIITKEEFIEMYQDMFPESDATPFAEKVFRAYDTDQNGVINFREFLCALSVTTRGSAEEKLGWSFNLYDADGDGYISRSEATDILTAIFRLQGKTDVPQKAEEEALTLFSSLDKNKDDRLSLKEFVSGAKTSDAIAQFLRIATEGD